MSLVAITGRPNSTSNETELQHQHSSPHIEFQTIILHLFSRPPRRNSKLWPNITLLIKAPVVLFISVSQTNRRNRWSGSLRMFTYNFRKLFQSEAASWRRTLSVVVDETHHPRSADSKLKKPTKTQKKREKIKLEPARLRKPKMISC